MHQVLLLWMLSVVSFVLTRSFVYNNLVKGQCYAASSTPTKAWGLQSKYVCYHCYSDDELLTDAHIKERGGRGAQEISSDLQTVHK